MSPRKWADRPCKGGRGGFLLELLRIPKQLNLVLTAKPASSYKSSINQKTCVKVKENFIDLLNFSHYIIYYKIILFYKKQYFMYNL